MEGREKDHGNICIYSNQSVNTAHGADKGRPMGGLRPRCGLRWSRRRPGSSLGGSSAWPRVMWEPRGPPSGAKWGDPLVALWWISILFVSIFHPPPLLSPNRTPFPAHSSPATSATDVKHGRGISICVKDDDYGSAFPPLRLSRLFSWRPLMSKTDVCFSRFLFLSLLLLEIDGGCWLLKATHWTTPGQFSGNK